MRVACIDIGTNSVLLLVAEASGDGPRAVVERATVTRLGQGVDATGELAPEARERTLRCLAAYADEARALRVSRFLAVGTSAMRDARGGADFAAEAAALLGGETPRVISGDEEAQLTFQGALSGLSITPGPVTVFDIGGGSTELITREASGGALRAVSLNIGAVRLTERHLRADPPGPDEVAALRAAVVAALAAVRPPPAGTPLVGVAGTVTTIAAVAHQVVPYDGERVHGSSLSQDEASEWAAKLVAMPLADRRALPGMEPKRADVIAAGAVLAEEVMRWAGATALTVSDRGVRWGLALRALSGG